MISEGLCDTEDWSNDAENSALPSYELYLKTNILFLIVIFHNITDLESKCTNMTNKNLIGKKYYSFLFIQQNITVCVK